MLCSIKAILVNLLSPVVVTLISLPTFAAYVPPTDQVPPRARGGTAGRRSACELAKPETKKQLILPATNSDLNGEFLGLVALAPASHMGSTVSDRPSLVWYTHNCNSVSVQLSIYEYDLGGSRLQPVPLFTQQLNAQPGINRFRLPENTLQPGKTYAWQVVAIADTPAKSAWFRIPLQVLERSSDLERSLGLTNVAGARVEAYAKAGFWYDALAAALDAGDQAQISSLLNQLAQLEAQKEPREQPTNRRFSESLTRVAKNMAKNPQVFQLSAK
ncbi:MAG: DUF928 domain-containing protein [Pseudanabaenaceae cyanobacterium bins.68]|nr:DUF928 domain-containing protein [Pseudanabaenaceae cyanobacterium bins.68]